MKKLLALVLILATGLLLPACGNNEENPSPANLAATDTATEASDTASYAVDKERTEKTLTGYFSALKSHDLVEMKKYMDISIYPTDEESYKKQFVDTVIDCKLESVDYSTLKIIDDHHFSVNIDFMINYSDDYIPVGGRTTGVNDLTEKFTFEYGFADSVKDYKICAMTSDLSD